MDDVISAVIATNEKGHCGGECSFCYLSIQTSSIEKNYEDWCCSLNLNINLAPYYYAGWDISYSKPSDKCPAFQKRNFRKEYPLFKEHPND